MSTKNISNLPVPPESSKELYTQLQNKAHLADWQRYLVEAAQVLAVWHRCIVDQDCSLNALAVDTFAKNAMEASWGPFDDAAKYLLIAASSEYLARSNSKVPLFLLELQDEFLQLTHRQANGHLVRKQLIQKLYNFLRSDPQALVATLALFHIHISQCKGKLLNTVPYCRPLDLHSVFQTVAVGLNIWILKREWQEIYLRYKQPEVNDLEREYRQQTDQRGEVAQELIADIKHQIEPENVVLIAEHYQRQLSSLWKSRIAREDLVRAVFLRITCELDEHCYLAEHWVEKQGRVLDYLSRKSLCLPEENGARRMQIAVRLTKFDKPSRLLVARIGTKTSHHHNEWGRLFDITTGRMDFLDKPEDSCSEADELIEIQKWTGIPVSVERGSTVADFVIQEYPHGEAEYCIATYVNSEPTELGYELQPNDIVRVVIDRHLRSRQPVTAWVGHHKSNLAQQFVRLIQSQQKTNADRGKNRITIVLQDFLKHWGLSITEDELLRLLGIAEITSENASTDETFELLADEHSHDARLQDLALQYKMRGRISFADDRVLDFNWRDVHIAKCCRPIFEDTIIGTRITGAHHPDDPRYRVAHDLRVHRKGCPAGPHPTNLEPLKWLNIERDGPQEFGAKFMLLVRDQWRLLGEIMNSVYKDPTIKVHYVHADAVNFGDDVAHIALLISSRSYLELTQLKRRLETLYQDNIYIQNLSSDETREVTQKVKGNPYITAIEPKLIGKAPMLMIGREKETQELKVLIRTNKSVKVALVGYYRTGKTWFLHNFARVYNVPSDLLVYVSLDIYSPRNLVQDKVIVRGFYQRLLSALNDRSPRLATEVSRQNPATFDRLLQWLKYVTEYTGLNIVFLVDEFDVINDWLRNKHANHSFVDRFARFVEEAAGVSFIFVFQAARLNALTTRDDRFLNYFLARCDATIEVLPFTPKEVEELLTRPSQVYYQFDEEALEIAEHLTGGNPYISARLGKTIWFEAHKEKIQVVTAQFLQDRIMSVVQMGAEWRSYLDRITDLLDPPTQEMLRLIACLQFPDLDAFGDQTVAETEIVDLAAIRLEFAPEKTLDLLRRLEQSTLLKRKKNSTENHWQIAGTLLGCNIAELAHYREISV